jgi:hypothetical protein
MTGRVGVVTCSSYTGINSDVNENPWGRVTVP